MCMYIYIYICFVSYHMSRVISTLDFIPMFFKFDIQILRFQESNSLAPWYEIHLFIWDSNSGI